MNPCPCGYHNSSQKDCICSPIQVQRYLSRISGPLMDRIDLHVEVPEVKYEDLARRPDGEPSSAVAARVGEARRRQMRRMREDGILCNAQMGPRHLQRHCPLDSHASRHLEEAIEHYGLSARAYDRILNPHFPPVSSRGGGEAGGCKARDEGPRSRTGWYVEEDKERQRGRHAAIRRRSRSPVGNAG